MAATTAWNPERFRPLLHLQVRLLGIDPRFRRRFDSSDVVQETLEKAYEDREQYIGTTEVELVGWLRTILCHVLIDKARQATAGKQDVRLEASLEEAVTGSSARVQDCLRAKGPSPAEQAQQQEFLHRLNAALDQLPEDQREVVLARLLEETPVKEIAAQTGHSEKSVAGLFRRGLERLRELLPEYRYR